MSTDKTGQLLESPAPTSSPIENELPSYRAVSNMAVVSVICGVLASFSFANLTFLIFAVLAVALGWMANLAIKRHPDVLTGRRLANAGIAMGLIFGLVVITYTTVHNFILGREAASFAGTYAKVLKEGSFGDALLYRESSELRKAKTAADAEKEFEKMRAQGRAMADQKMASLVNIRKALAPKDAHLHFIDIETQGQDESIGNTIQYYAAALYEVEDPSAKGEQAAPVRPGPLQGRAQGPAL